MAGRALFSQHQVRRLLGADARDAVDPPVEYLERVVDLDALPEAEYEGALEMRHYLQAQLLRDTDAMGMRHSLEIRTPLVDRTLLAEVARIPAALRFAGPAKRYLREAPAIPVPREAWDRPKRGFTLPFGEWMRRGAVDVSLPDHPLLDREATERVWRAFVAGRLHWSRAWALLVLGVFLGDDQPSLATPVSKRPAVGEAA